MAEEKAILDEAKRALTDGENQLKEENNSYKKLKEDFEEAILAC